MKMQCDITKRGPNSSSELDPVFGGVSQIDCLRWSTHMNSWQQHMIHWYLWGMPALLCEFGTCFFLSSLSQTTKFISWTLRDILQMTIPDTFNHCHYNWTRYLWNYSLTFPRATSEETICLESPLLASLHNTSFVWASPKLQGVRPRAPEANQIQCKRT